MQKPISKIVIVGGGAAGWITAGLLAAHHNADKGQLAPSPKLDITLIESPDVATIGVGEGTWPSMRSTLEKIGINETQFLLHCDASFKQGSKFINWCTETTHTPLQSPASYLHPFSLPAGQPQFDISNYWLPHHEQVAFAAAVSNQEAIAKASLAPKLGSTKQFGFINNYGYHLDAGKFSELLREHCTGKLGVNHIRDHVDDIHLAELGDIESVKCRGKGLINGDLFIDCSGVKSLLLGGVLNVPFICQKQVLFNDCALAVQVPYDNDDTPIASNTHSTALDNGWVWDIGLPTRRGVGHVYSSDHQSDDQALEQLITYLTPSIGDKASDINPRKLSIAPGYRASCWHKNCVAIGMASGFIEPLEASALALVEWLASQVAEQLPANRQVMDTISTRVNKQFEQHWQQIIEFLKLHYVLSERQSDYWQDHRHETSSSDELRHKLALWRHHVPSVADINHRNPLFPAASYQYVLYGMRPNYTAMPAQLKPSLKRQAQQLFNENQQRTMQLAKALPSNRDLLQQLASHPFPLI
ncbi:tryptophan 7-halogenase [Shewanella sp. WXL01]|uniref:tryptophan halogenase family protein n=1 Tax=Shewanella sp. WXL01 TaxID=2709721 RepID=UPI001438490A|nr:tryptophan halogenase family protein [Shewanella sp. WXL01]NKF51692.1 tryptophan 7-halogenase [Shewanella sp. WXL01]